MGERLFSELPNRDIFALLEMLGAWIRRGAESFHVSAAVLYATGALIAVGVGLSCYRLMRVWLGLLGAVAGYYLTGNGLMLFNASSANDVPNVLVYVCAIVMAAGLFLLSFKNPTYVFFGVMAVVGFGTTYFYTQNELFSLVGALLLALACIFLVRVAFILVSSFVGAVLTVSFLGEILPTLDFLQLQMGNWLAMGVVAGLSAVFAVFQFLVSMKKHESGAEKKPKPMREKRVGASPFPFQ